MNDYNNVIYNPDIEQNTIFRIGKYICEVDDFNYDNTSESIVFIYNSYKDFKMGNYLEQVSLSNENIKKNIEEYMIDNYQIKLITRVSLLEELKQQTIHNLLCYSTDYLMTNPKPEFKREWQIEKEKLNEIKEMLKEERKKDKERDER